MTLQIVDGWLYIDHFKAVEISKISHLRDGAFREAVRDCLGDARTQLQNALTLILSLRVKEDEAYDRDLPEDPGVVQAQVLYWFIDSNHGRIATEVEKHLMFGRWT